LRIFRRTCAGSRVDHDVDWWKRRRAGSKRLTDLTLDAIAVHGIAHGARGNRQPEPGVWQSIGNVENQKTAIAQFAAALINRVKLDFVNQTLCRDKCGHPEIMPESERLLADENGPPFQTNGGRATLHAKTLAALGATAGKNQTATFGRHAGTKTMDTLAVQVAGLISALHETDS
jgi:hypothetical protein